MFFWRCTAESSIFSLTFYCLETFMHLILLVCRNSVFISVFRHLNNHIKTSALLDISNATIASFRCLNLTKIIICILLVVST